jgi:hypothetical protein
MAKGGVKRGGVVDWEKIDVVERNRGGAMVMGD